MKLEEVRKHFRRSFHSRNLWVYLRNYKFNSILIRNFAVIFLLVVLPNALFGVFYNINSKQVLKSEIAEANMNSLYRSADTVETVMRQLRSFSYNLSVSMDVSKFSYMGKKEILDSGLAVELYNSIQFYTTTYDYVDSIYVYSEENGLVIYNGEVLSLDNVSDKTWLSTYSAMGNESYTVQSRRKNNYYPYYITLICPIKSAMKTTGAIVINVNIEKLGDLIGSNSLVTQELYMLDDSMRLYYSSDYNIVGNQDYAPEYLDFLKDKKDNFSESVKIHNEETIVSRVNSSVYPWSYVLLSPLSVFRGKMKKLEVLTLQVNALYLVLSVIVSYFITLRSFEPVRNIMDAVEEPLPPDEDYIASDRRENEVKYITALVRKTQRQNSKMKLELQERMEKLNNAQLLALQNQIDPHFLYNTLDTINWMAIEKTGGENEVSAMISTLAQLLRSSLQRDSYLVPVQEEIEHAKLYVKILELRYHDRLQVHWDISKEILDCKVVKLSIQPLIENALTHGLRARRYQGNIYIIGLLIGETAVISVEDDGVGMNEEERQELNAHLKTEYQFDDRHVGIRNVNQRFKLLFGDKYGIAIAPGSKSGGLAVRIVFPSRTEEHAE